VIFQCGTFSIQIVHSDNDLKALHYSCRQINNEEMLREISMKNL
jgi:hypothetical protein